MATINFSRQSDGDVRITKNGRLVRIISDTKPDFSIMDDDKTIVITPATGAPFSFLITDTLSKTIDGVTTTLTGTATEIAEDLGKMFRGLQGPITKNGSDATYFQTVQAPGSPFVRDTAGILFDLDVSGVSSLTALVSGTFTGQAIAWEGTLDGTTWITVNGVNRTNTTLTQGWPVSLSITGSLIELDVRIFIRFRARLSAIASGTMTVYVALSSESMVMPFPSFGTTPDDTFFSGNPVGIGGRAVNAYSAVSANNDAAVATLTLDRKLIVYPNSPPELSWQYAAATGGIVNTTPVAIKAAIASQRNYLKSLQIKTGTLTAETEFTISDGSTVIYRTVLKTTASENTLNIVFDTPLRSSVNTALNAAILTTATGGVFVNAQGYTGN